MTRAGPRSLAIFVCILMITSALNVGAISANGPVEEFAPANDMVLDRDAPSSRAVKLIQQTTSNEWQAGTRKNLTVFNESGGELRLSGLEIFTLPDPGVGEIRDLVVDSHNNLFIATGIGTVLRLDIRKNTLTDLGRAVPDEDNLCRLAIDQNDTLWGGGRSYNGVTPAHSGVLWRMNTSSMRFDAVGKPENADTQIRGMAVDKNGTIWVGTIVKAAGSGGRMARIDPTTGAITRINSGNPLIANNIGIFQIAAAPNGMIYAGTTSGGVGAYIIKVDPTTNNFQVLNSGNPIISGVGINSAAVAKNGTVYFGVGNTGGNLIMINPMNDSITILPSPVSGAGAIGDMYPAPDGSIYGMAGSGGLTESHLFKIDAGTGKMIDMGIPLYGNPWPGFIAVAHDGTVWGSGVNLQMFRLSPSYNRIPTARLERVSSGRIFTENFEMSAINWDTSLSAPNAVNYFRITDSSRPVGDQTVYQNDAFSASAYSQAGSPGPVGTNADAFVCNPACVLETPVKLNAAGASPPLGVRLFMNYYGPGQTYWLAIYDDTDEIQLWRDGGQLATYTGMSIVSGVWYDVKWKVYHVGGALPGAYTSVWINNTKIFDEVGIPPMHRLSGSVVLGTRFYNASFDDVRLYKDTNITVTGLQTGQRVTLYARNGTQTNSGISNGPAVVFNVNRTSFPFAGYMNVTATDGSTVIYTSQMMPDIYGGDVYDYNTTAPIWKYFSNGRYVSQAFDTGTNATWGDIIWNGLVPAGTGLTMRTRTASTPAGLTTASWSSVYLTSGLAITSPPNRWIQFDANFTTVSNTTTPELQDVTIEYNLFPDFNIDKLASASVLYPHDPINYTIYFNQTGNGNAKAVRVSDVLPQGLTFVTSSDETNRTGATWDMANLAPGFNGVLRIDAVVDAGVADGAVLDNTAHIEFTDDDDTTIANISSPAVSMTVIRPVMDVVFTGTTVAGPGDTLNYLIDYNNSGSGIAADLWIDATLDANLTITGSSAEAERTGTSWHLVDVAGSETGNITFTALVNASMPDTTMVSAFVTTNYSMPNGNQLPGSVSGTVDTTISAPVLEVGKAVDFSTAEAGDELLYTIYFNNTGSGDAGEITITDVLAAELDFLYSSSEGNRTGNTWTFVDVAAGSQNTLEIQARIKNGTAVDVNVTNQATLSYKTATGVDMPGVSTNVVLTKTIIQPRPTITLEKVADKKTYSPEETVTFTIYYNNTGAVTATNVNIQEELPEGLTFVTSSSESNRDGMNWNFSSMPGGGHSFTITATVDVNVANNTVLTNNVTMNYADPRGKPMTPLKANESITIRVGFVEDVTKPSITNRKPGINEKDVPVTSRIEITFSEGMDHASAEAAFSISPTVDGTFSWSANKMVFTPTKDLNNGELYTITVTTGAKDIAGNDLDQHYIWAFTTKKKSTITENEGTIWTLLILLLLCVIGLGVGLGYFAMRRRLEEGEEGKPEEEEPEEEEPEEEEPEEEEPEEEEPEEEEPEEEEPEEEEAEEEEAEEEEPEEEEAEPEEEPKEKTTKESSLDDIMSKLKK